MDEIPVVPDKYTSQTHMQVTDTVAAKIRKGLRKLSSIGPSPSPEVFLKESLDMTMRENIASLHLNAV